MGLKIIDESRLSNLQEEWRHLPVDQILRQTVELFGCGRVSYATALGAEGMVILHHLSQLPEKDCIEVFILDTGLLFPETYQLKQEVERRFGIKIVTYKPVLSVEEQAQVWGNTLWERNPDRCCHIRKVLPLRRALKNKLAWITSIRREQSPTRAHTQVIEWDSYNHLYKVNPLAFWTWKQVWNYIWKHRLPYNPLHDQGYPSIGCIPCTTPVAESEHWRAGRWRGTPKKECGIHTNNTWGETFV